MKITDLLIKMAVSQIGVKEQSHNFSPAIVEYQKSTWLEVGKWPWCAAFVCWCLKQAVDLSDDMGVFVPFDKDKVCRDASAFGWIKWAENNGVKVFPKEEVPMRGDIVVFDFSHIGIVKEVISGKGMICIEGNTNGEGSREGDGVYEKLRPFGNLSQVKALIRLR